MHITKKKTFITTNIPAAGGFLAHSGRATGVTYRWQTSMRL